jgi:hypothetical protein
MRFRRLAEDAVRVKRRVAIRRQTLAPAGEHHDRCRRLRDLDAGPGSMANIATFDDLLAIVA